MTRIKGWSRKYFRNSGLNKRLLVVFLQYYQIKLEKCENRKPNKMICLLLASNVILKMALLRVKIIFIQGDDVYRSWPTKRVTFYPSLLSSAMHSDGGDSDNINSVAKWYRAVLWNDLSEHLFFKKVLFILLRLRSYRPSHIICANKSY